MPGISRITILLSNGKQAITWAIVISPFGKLESLIPTKLVTAISVLASMPCWESHLSANSRIASTAKLESSLSGECAGRSLAASPITTFSSSTAGLYLFIILVDLDSLPCSARLSQELSIFTLLHSAFFMFCAAELIAKSIAIAITISFLIVNIFVEVFLVSIPIVANLAKISKFALCG